MSEKKYKIGLGLSGGGAKGIAHLGVIQAMEEIGMKPEIISGVSAGAIVGALYADGHTPKEILKFFQSVSFAKFVNISSPKKGLLSAQKFYKTLDSFLTAKTFEELKIPLFINASELTEGKNVYFNSGVLLNKIMASSSVPIALNPTIIDHKVFVDGGIFCNMPCNIIRKECETLVGVHVNPIVGMKSKNIINILERVYDLLIQGNTISEKKACDIVIEPVKAKEFGIFEISKCQTIFDIGYDAAITQFKNLGLA